MELLTKIFHKPAARLCRDKAGDAENGLRSTNRPLLVRFNRCRVSRARRSLREVADAGDSRRDKRDSLVSRQLVSVPEPGDASEAFLRIAPTRLL